MVKKQNQWLLPTIIVIALVLIIGGLVWWQSGKPKVTGNKVKIGVVTILSGPAAYEGESTQVGLQLAKEDLIKAGYNVDIIVEDYELDSAKALTSAKKLVEVDKVDGLYAEFNPATYAITPYLKNLKDNNTLFMYYAAPTSPLDELPYAFKSYFDYAKGCKDLAQKYKSQGIEKMGVLKVNMEFGEICNTAIKGVYGSNTITESYDALSADYKTQVLKLKNADVGAIINVAFEGDTITSFKAMKENNFIVPYGTVSDSVGNDTKSAYPDMIKNVTTFGYIDLDPAFSARVKQVAGNKSLTSEYPAAEAYIQIMNMVKAIDGNQGDIKTIASKMAKSSSQKLLGFGGYDKNRQAILKMEIGPAK